MKRIMYSEVFMVVIFFLGITITAVLAASPPAPDIIQQIANQQKRIDERVKSGALTQNEAKVLRDNLNRIKETEERLAANKQLTSEGKMQLNKSLDQNSKMIEDKKNNPVT